MRNRFTPDEEPTLHIADRSDAEIRIRRRFSHSCRRIEWIRSNFLRKFKFHRIGYAHSSSHSPQRGEVDVEYASKQFDDENRGSSTNGCRLDTDRRNRTHTLSHRTRCDCQGSCSVHSDPKDTLKILEDMNYDKDIMLHGVTKGRRRSTEPRYGIPLTRKGRAKEVNTSLQCEDAERLRQPLRPRNQLHHHVADTVAVMLDEATRTIWITRTREPSHGGFGRQRENRTRKTLKGVHHSKYVSI
ncbi:hypothetical protein CAEBREN_01156 [Caenorhabditis brenneri]|uniref:Uncharacterized protein n=1 Tax=Caenorhabditis brenneri TaxID=135651 RepID=G0PCZ4_CAEBE|nr:hypothetical protein CAEBREN_01156 [Caenorhabditis brenneri]